MMTKLGVRSLIAVLCSLAAGVCLSGADPAERKREQFIGILRLTERYYEESAWDARAKEAVAAHFNRLKSESEAGNVILAGRTLVENPQTMGIVIFEAEGLEVAREFMNSDPAVLAEIMKVEVFPYKIAIQRSR